jgi:hypothetical protein
MCGDRLRGRGHGRAVGSRLRSRCNTRRPTCGVIKRPQRSATKAVLVGELRFQPKSIVIVEAEPLIVPGHFIGLSAAIDHFVCNMHVIGKTLDLTGTRNAWLSSAPAFFARAREWASPGHAALVGDGITTALVIVSSHSSTSVYSLDVSAADVLSDRRSQYAPKTSMVR